ncbi:MAG: hypothetical protein ACFFDT_20700, partial [Candidatus Hodarchaeota archaeon]
MIQKRVSLLLILIIIILFLIPRVSAPGSFTVDIYETEREVTFQEDQQSQTIDMGGAVNFTGQSVAPVFIELSSSCELGASSISPTTMTFHMTGSEEFTVTINIPNDYENGTTGNLNVTGSSQQGSSIIITTTSATILITNYTHPSHDDPNINDSGKPQPNDCDLNLNNSENHQEESIISRISGIL